MKAPGRKLISKSRWEKDEKRGGIIFSHYSGGNKKKRRGGFFIPFLVRISMLAAMKIGLMTFLHQVIVSPSDVCFVTTNLPFLTKYFLHKSVSLVSKIFVTDVMHM